MTTQDERLGRAALDAELDAWEALGLRPSLWLRDDDAKRPSKGLGRLLRLCELYRAPLVLAVIPKGHERRLAAMIHDVPQVRVAQHGYAHHNHALPPAKKSEFPGSRDLSGMLADLERGWRSLARDFGAQLLPMFVPPWNRIDQQLADCLPDLGYEVLSTFRPRQEQRGIPELGRINCHADPMNWRVRQFAGYEVAVTALVSHLTQRRLGTLDSDEPTGVLCHHLVFDEPCWRFVEMLLQGCDGRVDWIGPGWHQRTLQSRPQFGAAVDG